MKLKHRIPGAPLVRQVDTRPPPASLRKFNTTWQCGGLPVLPDHIMAMFDYLKEREIPLKVVVTDINSTLGIRGVVLMDPPEHHDWDLSDAEVSAQLIEDGWKVELLRADAEHTIPMEMRRYFVEKLHGSFEMKASSADTVQSELGTRWEISEYRGVLGQIPRVDCLSEGTSIGDIEEVLVTRVTRQEITCSQRARWAQMWQRELSALKRGDRIFAHSLRRRGDDLVVTYGIYEFRAQVRTIERLEQLDRRGNRYAYKVLEVDCADRNNLKLVVEPFDPPPEDTIDDVNDHEP